MRFLVIFATLANVALSGHVAVRMPFLNPAGITYAGYGDHSAFNYDYAQPAPYLAEHHHGHHHIAYEAPAVGIASHVAPAVGYAQVPVKAAVAVPTVHHVPAVADVPVTKYEAQPAVVQKIVDVAKPAIKTRKFEVRRPAIQKQFYDIEERVIIRPVGSALVELDEPLSKAQKGPALVHSVDDHVHQVAVAAEHSVPVTVAPIAHHAHPVAITPAVHTLAHHAHPVAITPAVHTVAITPAPHTIAITKGHHYPEQLLAVTPAIAHTQAAFAYKAPVHLDTPYLHKQLHAEHFVSTTPAPIHYSTPAPLLVSSTPVAHVDDSIVVEAAARNAAAAEHAAFEARLAHEEAVAHAHHNAHHHGVEAFSNGVPQEQIFHEHHEIAPEHGAVHNLNHLSHEEAQENQQRLIKLLTARGGVAEVGFGRAGYAEHVGDAGISRARVLSATPSPHHEPVEEKVKTRRIVVSHPVQTLQEIDVVEPATKLERVAINEPTYIKTAKVGVQRVHTSVPVYGKALAPAIAHAQVPVGLYHHHK